MIQKWNFIGNFWKKTNKKKKNSSRKQIHNQRHAFLIEELL